MEEKTQKILEAIEANTQEKIDHLTAVLDNLTTVSQDNMISSLIQNENIFTQVKSHIIRQDLIVEKYQVIVRLKYPDESFVRNKLLEEVHMEYYVRNVSSNEKLYPVDIYVFNNTSNFDLTPDINRYNVNELDCLDKKLKSEIRDQRQKASQSIGFEKEVSIKPNSSVKIEIGFQAYREENDHELFVTSHITDEIQIRLIQHPKNIDVYCYPLHPRDSFIEAKKGHDLTKIWEINSGLLPFQGFYFCWRKNYKSNKDAVSKFKDLSDN